MRRLGLPLLLLTALISAACASRGAVPRPFPGAAAPPVAVRPGAASPPSASAPIPPPTSELVRTALAFQGTPYRNGGSDPTGFDCSGFVQWVFNQQGVRLPRQVVDQYQEGEEIDLSRVAPGDLLFFETVSRGASHVGVAIGGDAFVHAPSSRGVVRTERFTAPYWSKRFVGARRISTPTTRP